MEPEHSLSLKRSGKHLCIFIILLVLIALYSSFLTSDVITGDSDNLYSRIVKYITILLCLLMTLLIGRDGHDFKDRLLLQTALVLHAAGDFCTGILGHLTIGIIFFFFMQISYIIRHSRGFVLNRKEIISALCIYIPLGVLFVLISPKLIKAGIFIPVLIYSTVLVTSVWIGIGTVWRTYYTRTIDYIIVIAMISFFFCDLNVGLYNSLSREGQSVFTSLIGLHGSMAGGSIATSPAMATVSDITVAIPFTVRSIIGFFVWFFYLPAVVLLSLSGYRLGFIRSIFPLIPDMSDQNPASKVRE
jgi:hypothetical protein